MKAKRPELETIEVKQAKAPIPTPKKNVPWRLFFQLIKEIRVPWLLYIGIFIISIFVSRATVALPMKLGETLDAIMFGEFDNSMIVRYIILSIGVMISFNVTSALAIYANNITTRRAREVSWEQILRVPLIVHRDDDDLNLISRITHDPAFIANIIDATLRLVTMTYTFYLTLKTMWTISNQFTKAVFMTFPYLILVAFITGGMLEKTQRMVQLMQARLIGFFAEHYGKLKLVKVFSKEEEEDRATDAFTDQHFRSRVKRWFVDTYAVPLRSSTQALLTGITLIYGAVLIQRGQLAPAMLVTMHSYTSGINNYFIQYISYYQSLRTVKGSVTKISTLFDAERENLEGKSSVVGFDEANNLLLDNVSFAYRQKDVLKAITGSLKLGTRVALLGPSGSGKTTLFNILLRLYQPQQGQIRLDDEAADNFALGEWRSSIGYASQDPVLFHGTVRDNMLYGIDRKVSDDEIIKAAADAGLDVAKDFRNGLDTQVGEYGSQISGGQRQRVAIARLFLQDPKLLLLDEVSSALDAETADEIKTSLLRLKQGRTSVEIAHKIHEVRDADLIWVMDSGELSATGTHNELMSESPLYKELVDTEEEKLLALDQVLSKHN
ncbi:MAG: ABC transporter ATP-binding protein [Eubacteriales bacterium]|nr:ABC transporter ATP-binding protein [Eubacteriales bacterium]